MSSNAEKVTLLKLSDIVVDDAFNARSGNYTEAEGDDEANSFADLVKNMRAVGQNEPVVVKPKGQKFFLVAGFRRYKALKAISEGWNPEKKDNSLQKTDVSVKAFVRDLDDIAARELNVTENTARDDLKGSDLCFAVGELLEMYKAKGTVPTDAFLAERISMSQPYVNRLTTICKGVKAKLLKAWREAPIQLSVKDMVAIARETTPERQEEEYNNRLKNKTPEEGGAKGKNRWIETAVKKGIEVGTLLGNLEREELITTDALDFLDNLDNLGIKIKTDATKKQREKIAGATEKAYNAALDAEPEAEQTEE